VRPSLSLLLAVVGRRGLGRLLGRLDLRPTAPAAPPAAPENPGGPCRAEKRRPGGPSAPAATPSGGGPRNPAMCGGKGTLPGGNLCPGPFPPPIIGIAMERLIPPAGPPPGGPRWGGPNEPGGPGGPRRPRLKSDAGGGPFGYGKGGPPPPPGGPGGCDIGCDWSVDRSFRVMSSTLNLDE